MNAKEHAEKMTTLAKEFHAALVREFAVHRELLKGTYQETPWSWCRAGGFRDTDPGIVAKAGETLRGQLENEREREHAAWLAEQRARQRTAPDPSEWLAARRGERASATEAQRKALADQLTKGQQPGGRPADEVV